MKSKLEQLEFMLSESLDAGRGVAMPEALREWLIGDSKAAALRNEYERLSGMLKGWRVLPANIDLKRHAAKISESIAEARGTGSLTELVPQWSGPVPEVDYDALKRRISAAVLNESAGVSRRGMQKVAVKRRRVITWMGRIAAPLAVAAAIAIAVWWPRDVVPVQQGQGQLADAHKNKPQPMVVVSLDTPKDSGKVKIKFDEAAGKPIETPTDEGPGMAVGGSDDADQTADDDAFLY